MSDQAKASSSAYLEYLDKEMTIEGILSAFCVTVVAAVLKACADAQGWVAGIWRAASPLIWTGSIALTIAALFFYRQRALLAWYYGQLALKRMQTTPVTNDDWSADNWLTWLYYRIAFTSVTLGFVCFFAAPLWAKLFARQTIGIYVLITCLVAIAAAFATFTSIALRRFPDSIEHPMRRLLKQIFFSRATISDRDSVRKSAVLGQ